MKFRITFKDPDGVYESLENAADVRISQLGGLTDKEQEMLKDSTIETFEEDIKPWVDCSEYVTIEFDTDANTATVCKVNE